MAVKPSISSGDISGDAVHMGSMTTFEARVGCTAQFHGDLSIVTQANVASVRLPLPLCTVELKANELIKVEGQDATEYFGDLWDAIRFADNHGVGRKPGAITILTPCRSDNGIPVWSVTQIHDRAVVKAAAAR